MLAGRNLAAAPFADKAQLAVVRASWTGLVSPPQSIARKMFSEGVLWAVGRCSDVDQQEADVPPPAVPLPRLVAGPIIRHQAMAELRLWSGFPPMLFGPGACSTLSSERTGFPALAREGPLG